MEHWDTGWNTETLGVGTLRHVGHWALAHWGTEGSLYYALELTVEFIVESTVEANPSLS